MLYACSMTLTCADLRCNIITRVERKKIPYTQILQPTHCCPHKCFNVHNDMLQVQQLLDAHYHHGFWAMCAEVDSLWIYSIFLGEGRCMFPIYFFFLFRPARYDVIHRYSLHSELTGITLHLVRHLTGIPFNTVDISMVKIFFNVIKKKHLLCSYI